MLRRPLNESTDLYGAHNGFTKMLLAESAVTKLTYDKTALDAGVLLHLHRTSAAGPPTPMPRMERSRENR
jgi:hypothetical protein